MLSAQCLVPSALCLILNFHDPAVEELHGFAHDGVAHEFGFGGGVDAGGL